MPTKTLHRTEVKLYRCDWKNCRAETTTEGRMYPADWRVVTIQENYRGADYGYGWTVCYCPAHADMMLVLPGQQRKETA